MSKILIVSKEVAKTQWNKQLPTPLKEGEKVIIVKEQKNVGEKYIRVKHGESNNKKISVFNKRHFLTLKGERYG